MPWPPTGLFDPVIDISDQIAGPTPAGLETDPDQEVTGIGFDPQTNMIGLGITSPTQPEFSALPAPDEVRFKDVDTSKKRQTVVDWAISRTKMGIWYQWGGTTDKGYDCSGLVLKAFAQAGINMPRLSWSQAARGKRVKLSDLQPGDLVAWDHQAGDGGADHIAIYIGNGQIAEAAHTGSQLRVRKLGKRDAGAWGVKLAY